MLTSYGLIIFAITEDAVPEIIDDGVTGFLVEKSSPDQIVEKLEVLIKDPELREKMGAAARKKPVLIKLGEESRVLVTDGRWFFLLARWHGLPLK